MYVPATNPDIVILLPVPAIAPGLIIQFPAGKPVNTTLPVGIAQPGCVIIPTTGAEGVPGCGSITTLDEAMELHPEAFVTV